MKKAIHLLVFLLSLLFFQGCCSLKLSNAGKLRCAGKGVSLSLDRFIIRLKNDALDDNDIIRILELALPQHKPIRLERCKCEGPDTDLRMVILGEPMKSKGDLLTSVTGLKNGDMDTDPIIVYKPGSIYSKIRKPRSSTGGPSPNVGDLISTDTSAIVVAVLDSGLDLKRFEKNEKFLMPNSCEMLNPCEPNCDDTGMQSSGYNFVDGNTDIQDYENKSHGTFVTKKIVEELNNPGVDYKILPLKISKKKKVSYWDLLCAMDFVKNIQGKTNNSIKIINASLGFRINKNKIPLVDRLGIPSQIPGQQMSILKEYIDGFSDSTLVVVAAGNKSEDVDGKGKFAYFPANFDSENLITVGGLDQRGTGLHENSNYGVISVDIAAPYEHRLLDEDVPGTSIGVAQISASLVKFLNRHPSLTPIQLKTQFLDSAKSSDNLEGLIKDGKYIR